MKLLVLGGNGFIGKNIVESFSLEKNYEVLAPSRSELNLLDTKAVELYLQNNTIDVLIHSAVNINSLEENTQMYFNIARCSHLYKKLITIGSGAEYDMKHYIPKMKEEYFEEYIPSDTYGLSKFIASKEIEYGSTNAVNLRVFGIFGKYEDYTRRFISNNIAKALCGDNITLFKNMEFDFIYIKDFLKILELFIHKDTQHKNYNICNTNTIELLELAKIIHKTHGNENTKIIPKEEGMKEEYSGDNSRFLEEFGHFTFTPFEDAIEELYTYYEAIDMRNYCATLKG